MAFDPSITRLLDQLKSGDRAAAQPLWEQYFAQLVQHARKSLPATFRGAADEEDVALSAFASFFRGVEQGRFPRLEDRNDLWRILLMLVAQKRVHLIRRQTAAKRGGGKVKAAAELPQAADDVLAQILDAQPTPELAAQVVEECRRLLDKLGDDELRAIAVLQMEGHTVEEIARRLECSPRTVARKLAAIRDRWRTEEPCP